MRATKIAAIMSLLLTLVLGAAEASEMLRGRIVLNPGTSKHNASGSPQVRHCIKVTGLQGQVGCVNIETGDFHQLRKGELLPSGTRFMTAAHAHCELEWKGAGVSISSKSDVIVNTHSHELIIVGGRLHWVLNRQQSRKLYGEDTLVIFHYPQRKWLRSSVSNVRWDFRPRR